MSGISEAGMRQLFSFNLSRTVKKTGFLIAIVETRERSQFLFNGFSRPLPFRLAHFALACAGNERKKFVTQLSNQTLVSDIMRNGWAHN
jgi:hypothetical protein